MACRDINYYLNGIKIDPMKNYRIKLLKQLIKAKPNLIFVMPHLVFNIFYLFFLLLIFIFQMKWH